MARRIRLRSRLITLMGVTIISASTGTVTLGNAAGPATPLSPFFSDSGFISLSVDAVGTNDPAGAPITVHKNAGATVRKAFLFAASTGFSGYEPINGDVTLDGAPVAWNPADTINNSISSVNVAADVTSIVKAKVDGAPAGDVSFTAAEPNNPFAIDGEILAVSLDDPTVTTSGSITLLYGAQSTTGDTFHAALAKPVDKTNPNFALNLSLGISFGFQPSGQYSTVDVNGTRMTSSAGGQDDGEAQNGALITAGGIDDFNDNPPDPNATDSTCLGALGPAPRCDDELYSLLPFVNNGDTTLTFNTTNPSNDDNIFFAALDVRSNAAVVGEGIVLSPTSATNQVGQPHTLTATVQDDNGNPIPGITVHFQVTAGPNMGTSGDAVTDANGKAQFTYTSSNVGSDHIVASFTDSQSGKLYTSNEVTKTWQPGTQKSTSTTYTGAATVQYSDPATLSGTLLDTSVLPNLGIAGKQLDFTLGTQTAHASPTDGGGNASTSLVVTQKPSSVTTVATAFAGDATYAPSSDSDPFTITKEDCTLTYSGDKLVAPATPTTLAADMGEPDASLGDRSNKTVVFTVTGVSTPQQTYTARTDANGHATTSANLGPDVYGVSVSFAGDDYYKACSTSTDTLVTVQAAAAKVTGGGWISIGTGRTSFGFNAIPIAGGWKGQFQLRSNNSKSRFHGGVVTTLTSFGNTATWSGTGYWNGQPGYTYTISVVDNGSSGAKKGDTINITITSPTNTTVYTTGGAQALKGGNITVH